MMNIVIYILEASQLIYSLPSKLISGIFVLQMLNLRTVNWETTDVCINVE